MDKERKKDGWRDGHTCIQIAIPLHHIIKAEAEVRGCSIGAVIADYMDSFRHLMMTDSELGRHFKRYHPDLVHGEDWEPGSAADLASMEKEHLAQVDYSRKVQEVIEKNRKNMKASKAIARRKAIEKERRAQAEVGQ